MYKIAKIALLAQGLKEETVENIIEVCENTSNPQVALEKILGVYEVPEIPKTSTNNNLHGIDNSERTLVDFKELVKESQQITYLYKKEETKYITWKKGTMTHEEAEEKYLDNPSAWENINESNYEWTYAKTGKIISKESTCSIEAWLKHIVLKSS